MKALPPRVDDGFISVASRQRPLPSKRGRPPTSHLHPPDEQKQRPPLDPLPTSSLPLPPPSPPSDWYAAAQHEEEKHRGYDEGDSSQSDDWHSSQSSPPASPLFRPECPLCMEELDVTDLAFHPCPCQYRVCLYCYTNIVEHLNAQCPACRREYDRQEAIASASSDPSPLIAQAASERKAVKRQREREKRRHVQLTQSAITATQTLLSNTRVIQRNLVYVLGLPSSLAHEELLRRKDWFGRFGKVVKATVARRQGEGSGEASPPM